MIVYQVTMAHSTQLVQYLIWSIIKQILPLKRKIFPYNLYSKFGKPNLLNTLDHLDYSFWFLDNQYMKCKENIYIRCIDNKNITMRILKDEVCKCFQIVYLEQL